MHEVLFGKLASGDGSLVIAPPSDAVFVNAAAVAGKLLPFLSFDSEWGRLHFVYFEPGGGSESRFRVIGGRYEYVGDFSECNLDAPLEAPQEWRARGLSTVRVAVPSPDDPLEIHPETEAMVEQIWHGDPEWRWAADAHRYWASVERHARAVDAKLSARIMFGGVPNWTQNDQTPRDPDGVPMRFVGQLNAGLFTDYAVDVDLYLFYSPKHALAVQITQLT